MIFFYIFYILHLAYKFDMLSIDSPFCLCKQLVFFSLKQRSPNSHGSCNFTSSTFFKVAFWQPKIMVARYKYCWSEKRALFAILCLRFEMMKIVAQLSHSNLEGTLTSQSFIPRQIRIKETIK